MLHQNENVESTLLPWMKAGERSADASSERERFMTGDGVTGGGSLWDDSIEEVVGTNSGPVSEVNWALFPPKQPERCAAAARLGSLGLEKAGWPRSPRTRLKGWS